MDKVILHSDNVLRQNWAFLLMSQLSRGYWFIDPKTAISSGPVLQNLFNRNWDGAQAMDNEENKARAPFPVCAIGGGKVYAESMFNDAPEGSVAIVPVKGSMIKYGTMSTYGAEEIAAHMVEAASGKNICGLVLDVDSGGGAVDAVAPIVQAIDHIRNNLNKPVVASCDLAASAAYWVASACNSIVANNNISSQFGSIGVMCSFADFRPMLEKEGVKFHTIYAPESNQKNLAFEKALKGEYDDIKTEELSPLAKSFQKAVKENRGDKLKQETSGILAGRMFFAKDAKENGLIDNIGDLNMAVDIARDLSLKADISTFKFNQ